MWGIVIYMTSLSGFYILQSLSSDYNGSSHGDSGYSSIYDNHSLLQPLAQCVDELVAMTIAAEGRLLGSSSSPRFDMEGKDRSGYRPRNPSDSAARLSSHHSDLLVPLGALKILLLGIHTVMIFSVCSFQCRFPLNRTLIIDYGM